MDRGGGGGGGAACVGCRQPICTGIGKLVWGLGRITLTYWRHGQQESKKEEEEEEEKESGRRKK